MVVIHLLHSIFNPPGNLAILPEQCWNAGWNAGMPGMPKYDEQI